MATKDTQTASSDDLALNSRAMKALGVKHQPFATAILSDKNIYTDSILNKQYETLKHHMQFSDLILIVEGILGSGKTTLFRRLFQLDIASLFIMPIQAEATDTLVQLQQKMGIHMQEQGNASYLDDNLKNLQVFDQTPVLVIDDAHVLSDTTLQELLRYKQQLATEKETKLKLLFLANKGMAKTLEHISDLDHSQLYVQQMPKFNAKQILAFIAHSLKLAGAESLPQLNQAKLEKLAKKTDGIPAEVISASVKLMNNLKGNRSVFALKLPSRPIMLASTLIVLLAAAGWFLYPVFNPKMADLSSNLSLTDNTSVEPSSESLTSETNTKIQKPFKDTDNVVELTELIEPPDVIEATEPVVEPAIESIRERLPAPQNEPLVQPIPKDKPVAPTPTKTVVPLPAHNPTPLIQAKSEQKSLAPTPISESVAPPKTAIPSSAAKPRQIKIQDPALRTLSRMGIKNQDWLLRQNKNHWTLQVLGARDPQTLLNFVQTHHLGQDTAWYRASLNGADWYVLVHRFYTDRDIARNSISRLPTKLRQARPWVRSIDSIHKAVN